MTDFKNEIKQLTIYISSSNEEKRKSDAIMIYSFTSLFFVLLLLLLLLLCDCLFAASFDNFCPLFVFVLLVCLCRNDRVSIYIFAIFPAEFKMKFVIVEE